MYNDIIKKINTLLDSSSKEVIIVAVDGPCTSGKSSLADVLKDNFICNVFHMDDFFLPPAMKTSQRLSSPGGNVYYERFKEEVIDNLLNKNNFTYNIYDCKSGSYMESCNMFFKRLNIVEGVYALHPSLSQYYDLKIFMDVNADKQKERLEKRSKMMLERFLTQWVPLENNYFNSLNIKNQCDIVLDTSDLF